MYRLSWSLGGHSSTCLVPCMGWGEGSQEGGNAKEGKRGQVQWEGHKLSGHSSTCLVACMSVCVGGGRGKHGVASWAAKAVVPCKAGQDGKRIGSYSWQSCLATKAASRLHPVTVHSRPNPL